jgi:GNAT superfamily N-acetyltransferase
MGELAVQTRQFTTEDRQGVLTVLARAFADDPVIRWFVPEGDGGSDRLGRFFRITLADTLSHGEVHVAERQGVIVGAALWRRPGEWQSTGWSQLTDLPRWLYVFGAGLKRAAEGQDAMKKSHPSKPHWYLPTIGVDPDAQGLGIGGGLVASMLARCDQERTPAYLESSKRQNVPFYERLGFGLLQEQSLPAGPDFWPMWREPAATGPQSP